MRLRVHKRKVLALLLALSAAACCALFLRGGAGGERAQEPPPPSGGSSSSSSSGTPGRPRPSSASAAAAASLPPGNGSGPSPEELRALVYRRNFDQTVRNEARWGGGAAARAAGEVPVALVVQVHERPEHLRLLLESLRRAEGAERLLLVLSHDVWAPELEAVAAAVDFCAVLQVFFPFSRQLYPAEFPGSDPRDCPRDLGRAEALRRGCLNARYPDSFGHYREAAFAQAKHHWWWKLHFAWERLRALRGHRGLLLLLEEDHYLAPDFYLVLQRLWALRGQQCPDCQLLSLGSYALPRDGASLAGRADKALLKTWKSTEHNMGMAFARDTFLQLLACAQAFCTYDDYNWDWTLQHLTVACLPRFWKVLLPEVPRVFHTGADCGMHHRPSAACRPSLHSAKVDALLDANRQHLFPQAMTLAKRYSLAPLAPHVKNGGWGDIRDHELCKSYQRLQ